MWGHVKSTSSPGFSSAPTRVQKYRTAPEEVNGHPELNNLSTRFLDQRLEVVVDHIVVCAMPTSRG
jgi:hypothetical protein